MPLVAGRLVLIAINLGDKIKLSSRLNEWFLDGRIYRRRDKTKMVSELSYLGGRQKRMTWKRKQRIYCLYCPKFGRISSINYLKWTRYNRKLKTARSRIITKFYTKNYQEKTGGMEQFGSHKSF